MADKVKFISDEEVPNYGRKSQTQRYFHKYGLCDILMSCSLLVSFAAAPARAAAKEISSLNTLSVYGRLRLHRRNPKRWNPESGSGIRNPQIKENKFFKYAKII